VSHIFYKYPNFLINNKIIIIRTILSYDVFQTALDDNIINSPLLKNIYSTLNSIIFTNEKISEYGNAKNKNFLNNLEKYKNITKMPLWFSCITPTINKDLFFKKYNLDPSKKIFTIYLCWPKYYKNQNLYSEMYFLENSELINNIIKILEKLNYNVVFKPHPFWGMNFKPIFNCGNHWNYNLEKKSIIPMKKMNNIVSNYTFIEMCDSRNVDLFTNLGMIFSGSTFGLHNYLYNIPLLYVPDNLEKFEETYKNCIFEKYDISLFYGKIILYDDLCNKTKYNIKSFVKEYKNIPEFKYRKNNPLYDDTSFDNNIELFTDYIYSILKK
jgi:hypothetical protein